MSGRETAVHDAGSEGGELTCPRDNVPTRLRCTDCRTPICPSCFVRTPVGHKCSTCGAPVSAAASLSGRRRRWTLAGAAGVAVVAVVFGTWALLGRSGGGDRSVVDLGISPTTSSVVPGAIVGTGRAPDDRSWALEARADERGRICTRLTVTGARSYPEMCDIRPSRAFGPVHLRGIIVRGQVRFQSWGVVTEGTARVKATAEDGTTADAEVFGGDAGLGVKFFMSYADRLGALTLVAFGPNGEELGRIDPPPVPPPPGR